jgi:ornithine carbamoyltransferase
MSGRRRHLVSILDLSSSELRTLVTRGACHARHPGAAGSPLRDCVVGIYFRQTSTRTRTAFSTAALRLGAHIVAYGPGELQENTGESVADTGQVLSRMLDGFVTRTGGSPGELRQLAAQERMSVVNAMTADEHPTQAIADLTTLLLRFGAIEQLRVLYVGEGNNTAAALALALAQFRGAEVHLRTPPGYGLLADKLAAARSLARGSGATIDERHDLAGLPDEVDVVYTTRWQTTGTAKADPAWRSVFEPFRVGTALMGTYPRALFMHDLPAHRSDEVEAAVIDGLASIAFEQAENKLHSAAAVLEWCLTGT